jgi:hypothetical protein
MKKKIVNLSKKPESLVTTGCDGMAKDQKETHPPALIQAPKAIAPIMEAFHVESDKIAKTLVIEAATAIYGKAEWGKQSFSKADLDGVISLIRSIKPMDSLETLFASQIVVGHLLGMKKLSESCSDDQKIGLNLLRFSSEAMQMLIKKQTGATQNIVVNYSYNGQGNALMQTVLPSVGNECQS